MERAIHLQDRTAFKERMRQALTIDVPKTVLLTVDMQRKYLDLEIATAPLLPEDAERVLRHAKVLLDFARVVGIPVIHVYTTRRALEMEHGFSPNPYYTVATSLKLSTIPHAPVSESADRLERAEDSQIPAELVAPTDIHVTTKKTMDSYLGTELDLLLQRVLRPETVVLTGINTDSCVYSSVFSTANRGYKPVVISECVASTRGKDNHQMVLEVMARSVAWVLTVEEFQEKVLASSGAGVHPPAASAQRGQDPGKG